MGIWENLGMGGYRGFSRPAARLLQQAVQLAGDLGCEQADTSHLLLAMLQQPRRRARKAPVTAHAQIFPNAHVSAPCCI